MSKAEKRRIRIVNPEMAEKHPAPFDVLALALVPEIRSFYQNPANEAAFLEWQRKRQQAAG